MRRVTRGWPDEENRRRKKRRRKRRRWRDTLLETRRFAGTLSIGVLATPAVNILPLTNPLGGSVGGVADGERQADRAERADRARGWKKRENARWRARDARARKGGGSTRIARHGRS